MLKQALSAWRCDWRRTKDGIAVVVKDATGISHEHDARTEIKETGHLIDSPRPIVMQQESPAPIGALHIEDNEPVRRNIGFASGAGRRGSQYNFLQRDTQGAYG